MLLLNRKIFLGLLGVVLCGVGVGMAAQAGNVVAGATTVSTPVWVTAVTAPVFEFDSAKQAVNMQLPGGAKVIATVMVPAPSRSCGGIVNYKVPSIPLAGLCVNNIGIVTPPGSNLVDTIAADGGWAKSVGIWVLLADGTMWMKQVALPVKAPVAVPVSSNADFFDAMMR